MKYNEFKAELFEGRPEVNEEYDALGPRYEIIRNGIESRKAVGMTRRELEKGTGTSQTNIS